MKGPNNSMWFSLFTTVLILAITFYQGLQGLFSALITCILTVLAAALAFGYYENLYFGFLINYQPDHGRALSLLALFILSLLIMRTIFDSIITGNMHFPMYVDRAGGGIFGFVTAMLIVGILTLGFQMLPFGASFLGFSRYALVDKDSGTAVAADLAKVEWDKVKQVRQKTWLQPGGFAVSLASHLSANALQGTNNFAEIYPDFLGYVHRSRVNPLGKSRLAVEADALTLVGYWDLRPTEFFTRETITSKEGKKQTKLKPAGPPEAGTKRWALRVSIDSKAKDSDNIIRFTPEQVRLLARERKDGPMREYFLAGLSEVQPAAKGKLVQVHPGEAIAREGQGGKLETDLVYIVPEQADFQPVFLEFKQNARVAILPTQDMNKKRPQALQGPKTPGAPAGATPAASPAPNATPATPPAPPANPAGNVATPSSNNPPKQDRVSGLGPARRESSWSAELPFELTAYSGSGLEAGSDEMRGGRVFAQLDANWVPAAGSDTPIKKLYVPDGKEVLQLSIEKLQPESWLGNIYGGIIDTIGDFYIVDEGGNNFKPVGAYAMATVNGKNVFEMVFLDENARTLNYSLPKFEHIKPRELVGNYALYFLFHVPPKTKPVELHTGRKSVDLKSLNLEAP